MPEYFFGAGGSPSLLDTKTGGRGNAALSYSTAVLQREAHRSAAFIDRKLAGLVLYGFSFQAYKFVAEAGPWLDDVRRGACFIPILALCYMRLSPQLCQALRSGA